MAGFASLWGRKIFEHLKDWALDYVVEKSVPLNPEQEAFIQGKQPNTFTFVDRGNSF
jgi:hypothetical protein